MADTTSPPTTSPPTTLERLRIFGAIATAGTIAGAARLVGYSPSAVSQQLAVLEREVGVALVGRSNRGIELTAAGRAMAVEASALLDRVTNAVAHVRAIADAATATLNIAAFPTAITTLLLPAARRLAPDISLTMVDVESEAALAALRARSVDAAVVDGDASPGASEGGETLNRTVLGTEPIWVVARRPTLNSLASYAEFDWVLGAASGRLGTLARAACVRAGFEPRVIAETDDHMIAFRIIAETGAAAMLPELALADLPSGIERATGVGPVFDRRIEFVTRFQPTDNPALAQLAAVLALRPATATTAAQ